MARRVANLKTLWDMRHKLLDCEMNSDVLPRQRWRTIRGVLLLSLIGLGCSDPKEWRERAHVEDEAVGVPTGQILVIRKGDSYGAILPVDQAGEERGAFIRYAWWYQPDDAKALRSPDTETGWGEVSEADAGFPAVRVGPWNLGWSMGGDGFGWIYFRSPQDSPLEEYQLAITGKGDITEIDATKLEFRSYQAEQRP